MIKNFLTKKSFIDLNYVYSTLSNSDGENPLNYHAFSENPMELLVVARDAQTGEAVYFNRNDVSQDNYDVLKAFECGCDKVVVILTKPAFYRLENPLFPMHFSVFKIEIPKMSHY